MTEIYSQILSKLTTTEDREILFEEIDILLNSTYGKNENVFENTLDGSVRYWVAEIIKAESKDLPKQDYLLNLKNQLERFSEVKLEIAFEPTKAGLERIHSFVQKITGNNILIDLYINKHIVGGAVIIYNGKYRDFSMRKIFENEVVGLKEHVLKILSSSVNEDKSNIKSQIAK